MYGREEWGRVNVMNGMASGNEIVEGYVKRRWTEGRRDRRSNTRGWREACWRKEKRLCNEGRSAGLLSGKRLSRVIVDEDWAGWEHG